MRQTDEIIFEEGNFKLYWKADEPNPWNEYRTTLACSIGNKEVFAHSDRGEPEDNLFGRDWGWVTGAIELAYAQGRLDAENDSLKNGIGR